MSVIRAAGRRPSLDVRSPAAAAPRGGCSGVRSAPCIHSAVGDIASADAHQRNNPSSGSGARADAHEPAAEGGAFAAASGASNGGAGSRHPDARAADFDVLIERAIVAIREGGNREDPVFGPYAELNSLVRAVTYHEGKLLEYAMARLVAENPNLSLMPPETALPIVPAAVEMLKRNDWSRLKGIRLRSEVHHKTSYVPDLFIVDHSRHSACILDVKRSLASYQERRLNALRSRMMSAALIAGDWLHIEGRIAGVTDVGVAIIDGSSERRDRATGIFALTEIGELIGIPDAGEAMLELRARFARRVQEEVHDACIRAVGSGGGADGESAPADELDEPGEGAGQDEVVDDDVMDAAAEDDDEEPFGGGRAGTGSARRDQGTEPECRPVSVGFARGETA